MRRHPLAAIAAIVVGLIVAVLIFINVFNFNGVFARRASASLGRPVTVASARVRLFPIHIVIEDLNVAASDRSGEADRPVMTAKHIDAAIAFWPLFSHRFVFLHLDVDRAVTVVARDANGATNWEPAGPNQDRSADQKAGKSHDVPKLPEIRDLSLHDTQIRYRDANSRTDLVLGLETRERGDGGERDLIVTGKGTYVGAKTTLSVTAGSILALRDATKPYPVDGKLTSGDTEIIVKGAITDPVNMAGLDVKLSVKGIDGADLYRITGIALPPTPPYQITTNLDHRGARWVFRNMDWRMGSSDFRGEMAWDLSQAKPRLDGTLHSHTLDMDDLGGFIGAAPGKATTPDAVKVAAAVRERSLRDANASSPSSAKSKDRPTSDVQDASGAELAPPPAEVADKFVIPDETIDFEKINAMNADVTLDAEHLTNSGIPADRMSVDLTLQDGILKLTPLSFGIEDGHINVMLTVNAAKPPVYTDAAVNIDHYPIRRLVGDAPGAADKNKTTFGAVGGRIALHGNGDSMHRFLAKSDGAVGLISQGGEISTLLVDLVGLQLAKVLGVLLTKDKPMPIYCMAADFQVQGGLMKTRALVVDTKDSIVTGKGGIDLGTEVMNLRIYPKPKRPGIGALRVPLHVTGSFANPSIGPDARALAVKSGAAVALGVLLTPLGSLLATVETGGGKDVDCNALFAQVSQDVKAAPKH